MFTSEVCFERVIITVNFEYGPMPEFFTGGQILAWKRIVEAVHAAGGRIAIQLWHPGRAREAKDFADDDRPFAAPRNPLTPSELMPNEVRQYYSFAREMVFLLGRSPFGVRLWTQNCPFTMNE